MTASSLRRLVLPVVATVLVVLAVGRLGPSQAGPGSPTAAPTEQDVPVLEDPFADGASDDQTRVLLSLWDAWGAEAMSASGPQAPALPAGLAGLSFEEAVYVVLSVRVAQVAAADRQAEPGEDLATALERAGLTVATPGVVTARAPGPPGCVFVAWADEPFGRTFYGVTAGSDEPGPEPTSALEAELLRTVRVGLGDEDRLTCGTGGVAYSPGAQRALEDLAPELLEH